MLLLRIIPEVNRTYKENSFLKYMTLTDALDVTLKWFDCSLTVSEYKTLDYTLTRAAPYMNSFL